MARETGSGRRREAGALEAEVMASLWAAREPVSVSWVQHEVGADLSHKTVQTVLYRLWEKGLLERVPAGRGHRYSPKPEQADLAAERMSAALRHAGDRQAVLQRFLSTLDPSEEDALRAVLDTASRPRKGHRS